MAVFTNLSLSEIFDILSDYNIGELIDYKGISEGVENSNFFLHTTKSKFILTIYENRTDIESLPFFLNLMNFLNENNFACPQIIKSNSNQVVGEVKGKKFAIISFFPGNTIREINDKNLAASAKKLAELHNINKNFTQERKNTLGLDFWQETYNKVQNQAEQKYPELQALMPEVFEKLKNWPNNLPKSVIHGDFFPDNVMIDPDDNITGVIDFYMACNDAMVYDLAIAINAWCFDEKHNFDYEKASLFVENYNNIRPLETQELEALPIILIGAATRFLVTRLYDYFTSPESADVKIKNPIEYIEKLKFHYQIKDYKDYKFEL